jgi:hypothetical protein
MTTLVEGGILNFTVVARNKFGTIVSVSDASVTLSDATLGSVSVSADGSAGVLTASTGVVGSGELVASAAGVSSAPFSFDVVADTTVATVEVVVDSTVASVEVVPA